MSFQEWTGITGVQDGKITINNKKELIILKIEPINFKLKSELEQNAILTQYKLFLKNLNSKIQIIVSSRKTDISNHVSEVFKFTNENPNLKEVANDYIDLINSIVSQKGSITKEFYIVFENSENAELDISKISEYLESCGNSVERCLKKDIVSLISNYTNKRLMSI